MRAIWSIALCVGLAIIAITENHNPASAQRWPRPGECRLVMELPTTRLFIDAAWLDLSHAPTLLHDSICPPKPLRVTDVYLGRAVLQELGIGHDLGKQWFALYLSSLVRDDTSLPGVDDPAWRQPIDASIEMRTGDPNDPRWQDARYYTIHYRSSSPVISGEVGVDCGGEQPRQRYCGVGPYPRFARLIIRYEYSQSALPLPNAISTDPTTEPGAILQFDQRLREWLVRIQQNP